MDPQPAMLKTPQQRLAKVDQLLASGSTEYQDLLLLTKLWWGLEANDKSPRQSTFDNRIEALLQQFFVEQRYQTEFDWPAAIRSCSRPVTIVHKLLHDFEITVSASTASMFYEILRDQMVPGASKAGKNTEAEFVLDALRTRALDKPTLSEDKRRLALISLCIGLWHITDRASSDKLDDSAARATLQRIVTDCDDTRSFVSKVLCDRRHTEDGSLVADHLARALSCAAMVNECFGIIEAHPVRGAVFADMILRAAGAATDDQKDDVSSRQTNQQLVEYFKLRGRDISRRRPVLEIFALSIKKERIEGSSFKVAPLLDALFEGDGELSKRGQEQRMRSVWHPLAKQTKEIFAKELLRDIPADGEEMRRWCTLVRRFVTEIDRENPQRLMQGLNDLCNVISPQTLGFVVECCLLNVSAEEKALMGHSPLLNTALQLLQRVPTMEGVFGPLSRLLNLPADNEWNVLIRREAAKQLKSRLAAAIEVDRKNAAIGDRSESWESRISEALQRAGLEDVLVQHTHVGGSVDTRPYLNIITPPLRIEDQIRRLPPGSKFWINSGGSLKVISRGLRAISSYIYSGPYVERVGLCGWRLNGGSGLVDRFLLRRFRESGIRYAVYNHLNRVAPGESLPLFGANIAVSLELGMRLPPTIRVDSASIKSGIDLFHAGLFTLVPGYSKEVHGGVHLSIDEDACLRLKVSAGREQLFINNGIDTLGQLPGSTSHSEAHSTDGARLFPGSRVYCGFNFSFEVAPVQIEIDTADRLLKHKKAILRIGASKECEIKLDGDSGIKPIEAGIIFYNGKLVLVPLGKSIDRYSSTNITTADNEWRALCTDEAVQIYDGLKVVINNTVIEFRSAQSKNRQYLWGAEELRKVASQDWVVDHEKKQVMPEMAKLEERLCLIPSVSKCHIYSTLSNEEYFRLRYLIDHVANEKKVSRIVLLAAGELGYKLDEHYNPIEPIKIWQDDDELYITTDYFS